MLKQGAELLLNPEMIKYVGKERQKVTGKLWLIPVLLVGVPLVAFGSYKLYKYATRPPMPPQLPLPNGGQGLPQDTNKPGGWSPVNISQRAKDVMDGLTDNPEKKAKIFQELYELTPDQLTMVYNHFNKTFGKGESLYAWIDGEYLWFYPAYDAVKQKLLKYMVEYNLV